MIPILLDGERVSQIAAAQLNRRRPLSELMPESHKDPAGWALVEADAEGNRFFSVREPVRNFKDRDIELFASDSGTLAIGLFRRLAADIAPELRALAERPTTFMTDITEIRVHTELPKPPAPVTAPLRLLIAGSGPAEISDAELEKLPEIPNPGPPRRAVGRDFKQVLALRIDPAAVSALVIEPAEGEPVRLDGALLRDPKAVFFFKRNKRGELRLTVWRAETEGAAPAPLHSIKNIRAIRVQPERVQR